MHDPSGIRSQHVDGVLVLSWGYSEEPSLQQEPPSDSGARKSQGWQHNILEAN